MTAIRIVAVATASAFAAISACSGAPSGPPKPLLPHVEEPAKETKAAITGKVTRRTTPCFLATGDGQPATVDDVSISYTVGTAGTITDVTATSADASLARCVEERLKSLGGLPILPAPAQFSHKLSAAAAGP